MAASRIKGITIEIQKHKLLGDAVKETKEKLETLKTAAEQAEKALNDGTISKDQYDALQREIIETENELKRLEEQANQSATALQKISATGEKLKDVGSNIEGAGKKLLPVTATVTALGTATVKTAEDFEAAMSKVAAVSGASGKELEDLTAKAREMGSKTKFSASEAAEAMNYMAMAGWKTEDMLSGIEGVMNLAAASGEDLATTSDIVFGFQLAGVVVNDSVTREAISREQMRKFLKFVHDDVCYCKYYEVVYILFHTGMRISEFCGLTLKDIDLENRTVNIDHQLQRTCDMRYIIETTKRDAGTRKIPITEDVAQMFQAIIEDRVPPKVEKVIDGYSGFLFYDENDMPLVAMHWQHRFNHMVGRYNDIYRVQMPNITPHVCRHTYCSNMAKSGMNPKTLQYLMGHSDISVTMNVYTHIGFDDAEEELKRMEEFRKVQTEVEKKNEKPMSQKMFKAI